MNAILLISTGLFLIAYGAYAGSFALCFVWIGYSLLIVGWGYARSSPACFGKRADGSIALFNYLLLLPYIEFSRLVWFVVTALERDPPCHLLLPNVYIGRRLRARELPPDVKYMADLTCEMPEPRDVVKLTRYRSFPILDDDVPSPALLSNLLDWLKGLDGPVYIHCARGRGRTGLVAVALLLSRGLAPNADAALRLAKLSRPSLSLNRRQRLRLAF